MPHPRRSAKKAAKSVTTPPIGAASSKTMGPAMAAARRARAGAVPKKDRSEERLPLDERDLRDPDDLEIWMAEQLRDWQLEIGAATLEQLLTITGTMLSNARTAREAVKNDLRQEGYLEGQINILETIQQQVARAVAARRDRIGEAVRRDA